MIAFLRWAGSIVTGTLNGLLMFALAVFRVLGAFMVVGLAQGDGLEDYAAIIKAQERSAGLSVDLRPCGTDRSHAQRASSVLN